MTNQTRKWIRAGIETLIHGGCAAFITGITSPAIGGAFIPLFSSAWFKMVGLSFAGNGGLRFFQWWSNNPLPPEGDTAIIVAGQPAIVGHQIISLNPLAKVQSIPQPPEPPKP